MKALTTKEIAAKYFPEYAGKVIAADLLLAYIFENHDHHVGDHPDHDETGCPDGDQPYVNSLELEKFVIDNSKILA